MGGACNNLMEESVVCSGHHFVKGRLIGRQIVLFH